MSNGHKLAFKAMNGNGNGKNVWKNVLSEGAGFGVAELAAEGTWLGIAAIAGLIPESFMNAASAVVGKTCIEPVLDPVEKLLATVCKLEECKPDPNQSREQRARQLARTVLIYVPAIAASWEIKLMTRRYLNQKMNIAEELPTPPPKGSTLFNKAKHYLLARHWSPQEKMIFLADEGAHLGALYALNNQLAPMTDHMIRSLTHILENNFGMPYKKAHELSTAINAYGVPNMIGAAGAMVVIAGKHLHDWPRGFMGKIFGRKPETHVERLAESLTKHTPTLSV